MEHVVSQIRLELKQRGNREHGEKKRRWLLQQHRSRTHPIICYGVTSQQAKEVIRKFFPLIKDDLELALKVGENLLKSKVWEEGGITIGLLRKMTDRFTPEQFETFDRWIDYSTNWAVTDGLSKYLIGEVLMHDASKIEQLLEWTKSKNLWRRRAAAVSLTPLARKGLFLSEVFMVAERLMTDNNGMVQNAVGWLLKEASRKHPKEVYDFLLKWKERAPALVLRYASELLPENMKVLKSR